VRATRAPLAWLLAAVALLAVAVGCGSDDDPPIQLPPAPESPSAPASSPPTSATPSASPTSTGDAVNDSFVLFWGAFLDAQAYGDPDYPDLQQHATGQALAYVRETVTAYRTNGWVRVVQDGYRINSRVVQRTDTTARVTDVQDWTKWPLTVRATGEVVAGSTPPKQCITADLVPRGDTWVVTTIAFAQSGC
jgi:hypothetical protein